MGVWKSFDELEENLSLQELTFIIEHKRKEEKHRQRFAAALQGHDLDKDDADDPVKQRLEEVKRRAAIKLKGEDAVEKDEFADLGFGYEKAV